MRLKSAYRNAHSTWSPVAEHANLIACGTSAGTLSADFDTSATLDILRVDLKSAASTDLQKATGSATATNRFTSIAWGLTGAKTSAYPLGIIAGGLDTGAISFWNPAKIVA